MNLYRDALRDPALLGLLQNVAAEPDALDVRLVLADALDDIPTTAARIWADLIRRYCALADADNPPRLLRGDTTQWPIPHNWALDQRKASPYPAADVEAAARSVGVTIVDLKSARLVNKPPTEEEKRLARIRRDTDAFCSVWGRWLPMVSDVVIGPAGIDGVALPIEWAGGFAEAVLCSLDDWLVWGDLIARLNPIRRVRLYGRSPCVMVRRPASHDLHLIPKGAQADARIVDWRAVTVANLHSGGDNWPAKVNAPNDAPQHRQGYFSRWFHSGDLDAAIPKMLHDHWPAVNFVYSQHIEYVATHPLTHANQGTPPVPGDVTDIEDAADVFDAEFTIGTGDEG